MDSQDPGPDTSEQQPVATPPQRNHAREGLPTAPRGVLWVPFALAAGLTFLVPVALGQSISGTWVFVSLLVGSVAAASNMAWVWTHRPRPPSAAAHSTREANGEQEGNQDEDPLGHIHAVETQGRRHQKPCPNCGTPVSSQRERCSNCDHQLLVQCKGCRTPVRLDWVACPECGRDLP